MNTTTFCTCCGRDIVNPRLLRLDKRIDAFHNLDIPAEHAGHLAPFGSRCAPRTADESKEALYAYRLRQAGASAFHDGLAPDNNPYTLDMGAGVRWLQGYEGAAMEEAERAARSALMRARANPWLPFAV